jgi:hypothetical protein
MARRSAMTELSASHYLRIYRIKLANAQDGTTHPKPEWVEFMRRVVAALEALNPDARIRLEVTPTRVCFSDSSTGAVLAQFENPPLSN